MAGEKKQLQESMLGGMEKSFSTAGVSTMGNSSVPAKRLFTASLPSAIGGNMRTVGLLITIQLVLLFSTSYGRTIYVDPKSSGQQGTYPSIQAAIEGAEDGDEIVIKAGTYEENIVVNKRVVLRGEPEQTVTITGNPDSPDKKLCTANDVDGFSLENLVFSHCNESPSNSVLVLVNGGSVTVRNCKFDNAPSAAFFCSGTCKAIFENCIFQNSARSGLWVSRDRTAVKVIKCHFKKNKEAGIYVYDGASGEVVNCTFEENTRAGVLTVGEGVRIAVKDSKFRSNFDYGIHIAQESSGEIHNCGFDANGTGIHGNKAVMMTVTKNHAKENRGHGIFLSEVKTSTLTGNICEGNGSYGICIHRGRESTISENTCLRNKQNGFSFTGMNLTIAANKNIARENDGQGFYLGEGVEGELNESQSLTNAKNGILVSDSDVSLRSNVCHRNLYSGICAECGSMGHFQKNTCHENEYYGITIWDNSAMPLCEDNDVKENKKADFYAEESPFGPVRQMLLDCEFDKLDSIIAAAIKEETRNDEGAWHLTLFYHCLGCRFAHRSAENRQRFISAAEKWMTHSPRSQTPAAVLANVYVDIGWTARGGGLAHTVTEEGWKVFRENLGKGLVLLEKEEAREVKDPEFYRTMLTIARGLSRDNDWTKNVFEKGLSLKKNYHRLHRAMAEYLLPKWHGSSLEVTQFASSTIQSEPEDQSHILYAYIVGGIWRGESAQGFMSHGFDYKSIKRGFEQLLTMYPESALNANRLCVFACMYKDKETAAKLFPQVEKKILWDIWKDDQAYYNGVKQWAFSEDDQESSEAP